MESYDGYCRYKPNTEQGDGTLAFFSFFGRTSIKPLTILRILYIAFVGFVMFAELLLTSDALYFVNVRYPSGFLLIYGVIITGLIGCVFMILNKTSIKYLSIVPILFFAIVAISNRI